MDRLINENAVLSAIGEWIAHNEHTYTNATEYLRNRIKAIKNAEQEPCDCISRKAVLDKIKGVCFSREQEWVDFRISQGSNGQRDLIIKFIESLPSIQPKPKTEWIPVSKRLPEERGYYIVTEKVFSLDDREHKGRYNTMVEQVEYCNGKWQRARFFEVIAWMPRPKAYVAGSEEQE